MKNAPNFGVLAVAAPEPWQETLSHCRAWVNALVKVLARGLKSYMGSPPCTHFALARPVFHMPEEDVCPAVPNEVDGDSDGYFECNDCEDGDSSVNPGRHPRPWR